jgi:nitroimidazol reductase NimA-like FMN-containing flavoprotein (pyridoxamine 5'-phosphate oxidase superfamily)
MSTVRQTTPTPAPSERTEVRYAARGVYDRRVIDAILDEALVCHVGFVDHGSPVVIPTLFVRRGDEMLLHGSPATRMLRIFKRGPEVSVSVTQVDGLVLARSAFHHSANYRSVVVFGRTEPILDLAERRVALDAFVDKVAPGRRPHLRPMTDKEVRGTSVVRLPLDEASAKVRTGPPVDEEADYELPIWAGVIPVTTRFGAPEPDPRQHPDAVTPAHLEAFDS